MLAQGGGDAAEHGHRAVRVVGMFEASDRCGRGSDLDGQGTLGKAGPVAELADAAGDRGVNLRLGEKRLHRGIAVKIAALDNRGGVGSGHGLLGGIVATPGSSPSPMRGEQGSAGAGGRDLVRGRDRLWQHTACRGPPARRHSSDRFRFSWLPAPGNPICGLGGQVRVRVSRFSMVGGGEAGRRAAACHNGGWGAAWQWGDIAGGCDSCFAAGRLHLRLAGDGQPQEVPNPLPDREVSASRRGWKPPLRITPVTTGLLRPVEECTMTTESVIVQEVRRRAMECSARSGHDLQEYAKHLRKIQAECTERLVSQRRVVSTMPARNAQRRMPR